MTEAPDYVSITCAEKVAINNVPRFQGQLLRPSGIPATVCTRPHFACTFTFFSLFLSPGSNSYLCAQGACLQSDIMTSLGEDLLVTVNKLQDLVFNTIGNDSLDLPQIVSLVG